MSHRQVSSRAREPALPEKHASLPPAGNENIRLYSLEDVKASAGKRHHGTAVPDDETWTEISYETEHQASLGEILAAGYEGQYRELLGPHEDSVAAIGNLVDRAPHLGEVGTLTIRCVTAAARMNMPATIPPLLLKGAPGVSKTWFASRLGEALGLPFRRYAMSGSSLADGLQGSHPSWRNAGPGLVAKTLLREPSANPIILVDEFDKVGRHTFQGDPYRAFYSLLDPADSRHFTDEYLGFAVDASHVLWIMVANETDEVPRPILDRFHVIEVPNMSADQRRAVALSVYEDANASRRLFFEEVAPEVLDRLSTMTPRSMRKAIDLAMILAAASGRRTVVAADVCDPRFLQKRSYGFFG